MNIFKKWYLGHRLRVLYKNAGHFRVVGKINAASKKLEYHAQYRGTYIEDGDYGWLTLQATSPGKLYIFNTLSLAEECVREFRYNNVKRMRREHRNILDAKHRKSQEEVFNV